MAGVTLLAIAVPEQLATSQLADVPAFLALLAFVAATLAFAMLGSNPILSVGADSTIAPLFAVALVKLAAPASADYLVLVAATAVATGALVMLIGVFQLGWLADFLSQPIVAGFMTGIGVTIMVHQLPNALGVSEVTGSIPHRIFLIATHLSSVNGWTLALSLGTLVLVVVGERIAPKLPFALFAVVASTIIVAAGGLVNKGVAVLGTVTAIAPQWRFAAFHWSDAGVVATTAATVALVVLSQSAATSRSSADDLGVVDDVNRDFVALGVANILSGVVGALPVNASPARTSVVRVAGGRTQLVGLVAALGAMTVVFLAPVMKDLPLAALAGVLLYVASRLLKFRTLREILLVDRYEFALAIVTAVAVIFIGVQVGLGVAVGLAILDRTRRSARPRATVLGRRPDTTSWEPIGQEGAAAVDDTTVFLFTAPLYFANAALFRTEIHATLHNYPATKHVVIDAAAMIDIDFTGLTTLAQVVEDLARDDIDLVVARANDKVVRALHVAPENELHGVAVYGTVEEAVDAVSP